MANEHGYYIFKIPFIPLDFTLDLDVIKLENKHPQKLLFPNSLFGIHVDVYSKYRLLNQYKFKLSKNIFRNRNLKILHVYESCMEIVTIKVQSINFLLDSMIIIKNIQSNGFMTYYDYLNMISLHMYITNKKYRVNELYFQTFPATLWRSGYPRLIFTDVRDLNAFSVIRYMKTLINKNYTPIYGNLIEHFRNIAYRLGEDFLASLL
ncbi:MAG: hypothetical protein QXW86_09420 [Saccharolobus sp.]|uniref:hypothetical protein n=1 Tax=Saccharolobus sp. TaxID=2100761 RepID=UPI003176D6C7